MRLAMARRRKFWSIRELARRAGVTPRTLNTIELGQTTPSLRTIQKLSEALEMDPMDIDEFRDVIMGERAALATA
jgi:transcriptional regulator with XRE-family HTH domain